MSTADHKLTVTATADVAPGPLRRLRELAESRQSTAGNDGRVDVESIWPSEVLAILDGEE